MNKIDEVFGNFLPRITINKIILEKKGGFFDAIDDPHIESSKERAAMLATPGNFSFTYNLKSYEKVVNSKNNILRGLNFDSFVKVGIAILKESPQDLEINKKSYFINNLSPRNVFTLNNYDSVDTSNKDGIDYLVKNYSRNIQSLQDPENLIILYCSFIDIPQEYRARYPGLVDRVYSDIKIETIIKDGIVKSENELFLLEEDSKVWNGKIVVTGPLDNRLYQTNEEPPRKLKKFITKNYKIQDFRIKSTLDKVFLKFQDNNSLSTLSIRKNIKPKQKIDFFSDLNISKGDAGAALSFYLKNRDMIKGNSFLSNIYDLENNNNSNIVDNISLNTKILNFKFLRRRVELDSGLGESDITEQNNNLSYKAVELEEVLFSSRDDDNGSVVEKLGFKEIKNSFFSFSKKNRSFNIVDRDILQNKTDGIYQYGVEIEVKDGSIDIVLKDIKELQVLVSDIQKYYNNCLIKEINRQTPRMDIILQTDDFISSSVENYFKILLKYYVFEEKPDKLNSIKQTLKNQVSIATVDNIRAVSNYIRLLETLISNLSSLISHDNFIYDDPHIDDELSFSANKKSKKTYIIKKYFTNDYVDCNFKEKRRARYVKRKNATFFNEFTANEFISFMNGLKKANKEGQLGIIEPKEIQEAQLYLDPIKEIENNFKETFDVIVERKIPFIPSTVKNAFTPLANSPIYQRIGVAEENDPATSILKTTKQIQDFYEFCSLKISPEKIGKQVIDIMKQGEVEDFFVKVEYLYFSEGKTEIWKNINTLNNSVGDLSPPRRPDNFSLNRSINSLSVGFAADRFLIFRLNPLGDHRSQNFSISSNLTYLDLFFFVRVDTIEDMKKIADFASQPFSSMKQPIGFEAVPKIATLKDTVMENAANLSTSKLKNTPTVIDKDLDISRFRQ